MGLTKLWKHGQLTIPSGIRRELGWESPEVLSVVKVGEVLLLTAKRLQGDVLATKAEASLKKQKQSLEDVLRDLQTERKRYNKEAYGI